MNIKKAILLIILIPALVLFTFPISLFAINGDSSTNCGDCDGSAYVQTLGCYSENDGTPTKIHVWAENCNGCYLTFLLIDDEGSIIDGGCDTLNIDNFSTDVFYDLMPGTYTLIFEIECLPNNAENGFTDTIRLVEINGDSIGVFTCVYVEQTFTIEECSFSKGSITVFKYSGDQPLAGAVFDIVDGEGFAAKVTSGADGYAYLSDLDPGTYYVREVIAPEGYDIDPNQYTLVVEEGGSARVDIENDLIEEPTPPAEEPPPAELEVAGVAEELPYTGYNHIYYILGSVLICLAGVSYGILRVAKSKK